MILSRGESNTRWSASVSSTTPRLGARWPAFRATVWMMTWRISAASLATSARSSALTSAGNGCARAGSWVVHFVPDERAARAQQRADQHLERRVAQELDELLGLTF